ncbi:hypothetical protein HZU40_10860 [Mycolicibacterium fluoranthenivorans]|uniref:Uncharacterized protein n=1 Tax=Mycolicibacterium fluoranthenivorans TaxID=258505 RepID=A0A7G8PQ54_9MYCO|nr:hypothetical protein [Mycolicibacterium fluoranthenivorans]QNJ96470.1 hypothetical protein HZU40_10860 [Mycolicibacterium fluoranthenivorans]
MDFAMSARAADHHERLSGFMVEDVLPAEVSYHAQREEVQERSGLSSLEDVPQTESNSAGRKAHSRRLCAARQARR